jgi:glyoxylase-like metal-dependent hydrolase (beta-lactamase superfamily II)
VGLSDVPHAQIEDVRIHQLVDDVAGYVRPGTFFRSLGAAPVHEPDLLRDLARGDLLTANGLLAMSYHSYAVRTPDQVVIVDTCIGVDKSVPARAAWHRRSDCRWLHALHEIGIEPHDVDIVICTHLHIDHVGWNTRWHNGHWTPTFPNARYVVSDVELRWAREDAQIDSLDDSPLARTIRASYRESVVPLLESGQLETVPMNHELNEFMRLRALPGHTPGHVGVGVGRREDAAVLIGDLAHSPIQIAQPLLGSGGDTDADLAADSRCRFLRDCARSDLLLCSMHFPGAAVGHVQETPNGFTFVGC